MARIFPLSPSLNQKITVGSKEFEWNGNFWKRARLADTELQNLQSEVTQIAQESAVAISDTAPSSPSSGDQWFNSNTGQMFIYYDSFWIEVISNTEVQTLPISNVAGLQTELNSLQSQIDERTYEPNLVEIFSVSGTNAAYVDRTIDTSAYVGAMARVVFLHTGSTGYQGDLQIDAIRISDQLHSFENNENHNYQRSPTRATSGLPYEQVVWEDLASGGTIGSWNIATGNTGSGGTGELGGRDGSYYVYTEISNSGHLAEIWMRSPVLPISDTIKFSEGRQGANIGTLKVYLDIVR